ETPSGYSQRTSWNVRDSDATLVLSWGEPTGGTPLTVDECRRPRRPAPLFELADQGRNWATVRAARGRAASGVAPPGLDVGAGAGAGRGGAEGQPGPGRLPAGEGVRAGPARRVKRATEGGVRWRSLRRRQALDGLDRTAAEGLHQDVMARCAGCSWVGRFRQL